MLPISAVTRTIPHFTHQYPGHILEEVHANTEYDCDACKTYGAGPSFKCNSCDYTMRDWCTTCPSTLSSFMHPQHPLSLAVIQNCRRTCHICNEDIDGLFYYCQYCQNFDVHPICTRLPQNLSHVLHQIHPLTLEAPMSTGYCAVCRGECYSWRYRCTICNFDMHIECAAMQCVSGPSNSPLQSEERRIPPYVGYGYSSCGSTSTTDGYNNNCSGFQVVPSYGSGGYNQHNYCQNGQLHYYGNYGGVPYNYIMPQNDMYNMQNGHQESGGARNKWRVVGKRMFAIVGRLTMAVGTALLI